MKKNIKIKIIITDLRMNEKYFIFKIWDVWHMRSEFHCKKFNELTFI